MPKPRKGVCRSGCVLSSNVASSVTIWPYILPCAGLCLYVRPSEYPAGDSQLMTALQWYAASVR